MINKVLDQGYVQFVDHWGSDESIIEAARMSTGKGFKGWKDQWICSGYPDHIQPEKYTSFSNAGCAVCGAPMAMEKGDEHLLAYLYNNKHSTPFEMAGLVIEVKAPIFVFREWHRHRTQSYNEMSARYIPLPDENYMPTLERCLTGANTATTNKQAQGSGVILTSSQAMDWLEALEVLYKHSQEVYEHGIRIGIPKELARLPVPVARYSRMRASANLRNWLAFLTLRSASSAQWEIRAFAEEIGKLIEAHFPHTWKLFQLEQEKNK